MPLNNGLQWQDLPAATVQCHAANLHELPNGQLACVWFGGTQEGLSDICVWLSRYEAGQWSTPTQLSFDLTRSEQNPLLFSPPTGELLLLHTSQHLGQQDQARVMQRSLGTDGSVQGESRTLFESPGIFVRQRLVVLRDGTWLLPIFRCITPPGQAWRGDLDTSSVMRSTDQGRSWTEHAVPHSTGLVHMNIVPQPGSDALVAFFRSRWADWIYRSTSSDDGRTWSAPAPCPLPNNNSSIQALRLASGTIAMVFNASQASDSTARRASLYDDIDNTDATQSIANYAVNSAANGQFGNFSAQNTAQAAIWGTPRAPMRIALSDDEGLSWPHQRDIETGDGYCLTNNSSEQKNRELSYPSLHQTADATIHVAYTHHRQRIRHVQLSEAWIRS